MPDMEITIFDATTGTSRTFTDDHGTDEAGTVYMYSEGNYACDCNRALFSAYAAGEDGEDVEQPCGHERFTVEILEQATGRVIYSDVGLVRSPSSRG